MREIETVGSSGSGKFDDRVTKYVEEGMQGCLMCEEAENKHITIGEVDISDDGSTVIIPHECSYCGLSWKVSYLAYSVETTKCSGCSSPDEMN